VYLADLSLADWRTLDVIGAARFAQQAADQVDGRVVDVRAVSYFGTPLHQVVIERDGGRYALIPGGTAVVGYDVEQWQPSAELLDAYRDETLGGGFGFQTDPHELLRQLLSPLRAVSLPTMLIAVESERLSAPAAETAAVLAERGLRLPSPDEWEHACGAGAATLWWWGEQCPVDRSPLEDAAGPQHQPNAFGLRIAHNTYEAELTSELSVVKGGDGGESVCGGYGSFVEWLPLATANRNPGAAEFIHGPEGEKLFEDFSVRPVIDLV
jgi:hypothetical protein